MAVIQSGAGPSLLTVDPVSLAGRATLYDATGALIGTSANPLQTQQGNGRIFRGQYMASTFRTLGTAASPQNIASLFMPAGTIKAALKKLAFSFDSTAALLTVSPSVKVSRIAAAPTGGTGIVPVKYDSSSPAVNLSVLGGTASDGGAATAIVAAAGVTAWTRFVDRIATAVGWVTHQEYDLMPLFIADENPFILIGGEGLLVQDIVANAITSHFVVNALWEEFT